MNNITEYIKDRLEEIGTIPPKDSIYYHYGLLSGYQRLLSIFRRGVTLTGVEVYRIGQNFMYTGKKSEYKQGFFDAHRDIAGFILEKRSVDVVSDKNN